MLASETARLAKLWEVSKEPTTPPEVLPAADYLPDITLEGFQQAVKRFTHHTARTHDGIHPEHLELLSDEQQRTVISWLKRSESFQKLFGLL